MSIIESGHHFIAIFGGAVAGAEAASQLARQGFRIVVFDQAMLPYGKIEDGLPKWHYKLRDKEEAHINEKLQHENILFVPRAKLGRDITFEEVLEWGFSAVILATGAWRDRPLAVEGIDAFVGKGLIYQNPFVYWFNHKHEPGYTGPTFEIEDNALVVGGGLASLDVVKILMIETVLKALKNKGIEESMFSLEHGINKVLEKHQLTLNDLGLKGCTLCYRRRDIDMPLSPMATDTPEMAEKARLVRRKILENFQRKYLFHFEPCLVPMSKIVEKERLIGLRMQRTAIVGEQVIAQEDYVDILSPMVISSIGSIPEMIPGIPSVGGIFKISKPETCLIDGFDHVFAIGNAVTGKGNINESIKHGREITEEIMETHLDWHQQDYENWHRQTAVQVNKDLSTIIETIQKQKFLPDEVIENILDKVLSLQKKAGYDGNYKKWVEKNTPIRLEHMG